MSSLSQLMRKDILKATTEMIILDAAKRMRDDRIGALLVEKNGEMVGIVTDTDLVRKGIASEKDLSKTTLASVMTTPLITIESTRSIHDAHDMMGDLGVRHLVVCEAGKVAGIVSVRDLLVYFQQISEPNITQD